MLALDDGSEENGCEIDSRPGGGTGVVRGDIGGDGGAEDD
jgi:hypothetical protein